jgi:hypothetical protein
MLLQFSYPREATLRYLRKPLDPAKFELRQLIIEAAQEVTSEPHPSVKKLRWKQLWDNLDQLEAQAHYMLQGAYW